MKRILGLLILILMLTACVQNSVPNQNIVPEETPALPQESIEEKKPQFDFDNTICAEDQLLRESGEVAGYYSYCLPMMTVVNGNELSEKDRTEALRIAETFNARMNEVLEESVLYGKELLDAQKVLVEEENVDFIVCDECSATVRQNGQIVSVISQCYFYGGGVHPYSHTVTYTFDLSAGQFIDPAQIGDDPEYFRTVAAEALIRHAESLGEEYTEGFWADYRDIISRWNETAVYFDETGMTVIFSAYELGPYAMGPVELTLTYAELADMIGDGGLSHLGVIE